MVMLRLTSKRNHLNMPLPESTSQVSLLILCDEVSMMNILMHTVSSYIRSLARRVVNTLDRHLRKITVGSAHTIDNLQTRMARRVVKNSFSFNRL
jgi:formyltetrahydrofolate synthetase